MWTSAIKVNRKNRTAHFNIYFSFWEVYNNNKTKNENTMHVRSIAHVHFLAYVPVGAHAIVRVSGCSMLLPSNRSLEGTEQPILTYIFLSGKYITITKQKMKILCMCDQLHMYTFLRMYLWVHMRSYASQGAVCYCLQIDH